MPYHGSSEEALFLPRLPSTMRASWPLKCLTGVGDDPKSTACFDGTYAHSRWAEKKNDGVYRRVLGLGL